MSSRSQPGTQTQLAQMCAIFVYSPFCEWYVIFLFVCFILLNFLFLFLLFLKSMFGMQRTRAAALWCDWRGGRYRRAHLCFGSRVTLPEWLRGHHCQKAAAASATVMFIHFPGGNSLYLAPVKWEVKSRWEKNAMWSLAQPLLNAMIQRVRS